MAEETNNSEEEVATEITLLEMVGQLQDANQLQKSMQESSLETTKVLTSIAKILQAQLDLDEQKKLKEGRQLGAAPTDDGGSFKFDKLEMPTSVADTLGFILGGIVGAITGFFSELRFLVNKSNVDITKATKKLKNIFAETKLGQMFKSINDSIKGFFGGIRSAIANQFMESTKGIRGGISKAIQSVKSFFSPVTKSLTAIGEMFSKFGTKITGIFASEVAKMRNDARIALKGIKSVGKGISTTLNFFGKMISGFFNFFIDPIKDVLKMLPKPGGGGVVSKSFEAIKKFFKMFKAFFSSIGRVLARVAYPITIVMGLFEAVSTAIEDFDSHKGGFLSKFIAGAFGFIKGAISFMITDFLDLIKSAVSWIIEKIFGKDNPVTKFLDSFSFTELFVKGIDIIRDFFLGIPKYFTDAFKMGGGVFGALGILVDDIIDSVKNIFGFLGEILGKFGDYVLSKIPDPIKKLFGIGTSGGDSLDQAGADLTSPTGTPSASAASATKVQPSQEAGGARVTLPSGKISVGGNKGTVTNADGVTRDLTKEEIADVRMPIEARDSDEHLLAKKEMHQSTIDKNAGDDSSMSRRKTSSAKAEIRKIDKEIELRASLSAQGSPKKIGNGTIATALNPPMMLLSSGNVPSPTLLGNEGSAVNQGQALQSGTSNLNDAKSRQQSAPPMMLSNSPNNSQTSNSNVSNNYTTSNVTAWDRYDPFANQMPSNAAK